MKRLDRARIIRDELLALTERWQLSELAGSKMVSLDWRCVSALLWKAPFESELDDHICHRKLAKRIKAPPPYMLDVWVHGTRVLSVSWNDCDELKLLRMVRGEWETDLFQLPPPAGKLQPTFH